MRYYVNGDGYESPVDEDDEDDGLNGSSLGRIRETFDVYLTVSFGGLSGEWSVKGLSTGSIEGSGEAGAAADARSAQDAVPDTINGWKTKFLDAQRKMLESQEEVKGLKERILEAVL
jgi:hypothetical protein